MTFDGIIKVVAIRILVVGASGRTGRRVVEEAVSRGHHVTALVRVLPNNTLPSHALMVVGDPLRVDELAPLLANQDVIISCLGQRSEADATLLRDSAAAILNAIARNGIRRYLVVSQGLLFASRNPVVLLLRLILRRHLKDSATMEHLVKHSAVKWTIVRPPRLTDGARSKGYRVEVNSRPKGAWSMGRADLAVFLVDEAEHGTYQRQIVGVTSA